MPSSLVNRSGEDVEAVVSILLCRRHPNAARRRPGQGDLGVDVYIPVEDGRIDVYQVKRFDRQLTGGQWSKIKNSYDTLVQAVKDGHFIVRNWYLAMPLDATANDEARFAQLTADGPFEQCEWRGLAWLDALASEFPGVIDYYLGEGKARLRQTHESLMAVLGARDAAGAGEGTAAVGGGLAALHKMLNSQDPLYQYDFKVSSQATDELEIPRNPASMLVFSARVNYGEVSVQWDVYARCNESVRERPIPIDLQFDASGDPALQESLKLFAEYGRPFAAPQESTTVRMDLPGGLGGAGGKSAVWVGRIVEDAPPHHVLRLRASRSSGDPVTVRLLMDAPTVGSRGAWVSGRHDGGAFALALVHDFEPPSMRAQISPLESLEGKPVVSAIDGLEFIEVLRGGGARMEMAAEYGPFTTFVDEVSTDHQPRRVDADTSVSPGLIALRALNDIQRHTAEAMFIPDFASVTPSQVREWGYVARILDGENVSDSYLGSVPVVFNPLDGNPPTGAGAFTGTLDLVLEMGSQRLILGQQMLYIDAATAQIDPNDSTRIVIAPLPDHAWTRTRVALT